MGLRNIADGPRPSTTITINGQSVTVRDLTWAEAQAVEDIFPYPIAPLGPDPRRGSQAPPISRVDDPNFIAALRSRDARSLPVEVAIATDWTDNEGLTFAQVRPDARQSWAAEAQRWVAQHLSDGNVRTIDATRRRLAKGSGGIQEAPGKD